MAAYTTIDDPTLHFQVLTYTGDGESTRALTLPGDTDMAPDLVWIKQRNTTRNQQVNDRVRGTSKVLLADLSDAESLNYLPKTRSLFEWQILKLI